MKKTDCGHAEGAESSGGALLTLLRIITFLTALALMALIVLYPRAIADDMTSVPHGALVGLLFGMSIAWVWGLGFVPQRPLLRWIFSPWLAWALMLVFSGVIFLK